MPICSKCGRENPVNTSNCAQCGADISESAPPGKPSAGAGTIDGLVLLATFHTLAEADMIREIMETNGITCVLHGETDPIGTRSGAEAISILVQKDDLLLALELYEVFFAGDGAVEEDSPAAEGDK
jgi:hypothetical protein